MRILQSGIFTVPLTKEFSVKEKLKKHYQIKHSVFDKQEAEQAAAQEALRQKGW